MQISRLVWEWLAAGGYTGRLLSRHDHSLNLIDDAGRVLTLLRPMLPMGPFAIQLPAAAGWPDYSRAVRLSLSSALSDLDLQAAVIWEPVIAWPPPAQWAPWFLPMLTPYAAWPALSQQPIALADQLRTRASRLQAAWRNGVAVEAAMVALFGLGNGLTPAGDDYLLGCIAAHLSSHSHLPMNLPKISLQTKTTVLSAAFLLAAQQGAFVEPWHELAQALATADVAAANTALQQIAGQGATSGQDALAGFAQTLIYAKDNR
ncbi:MAG: DUF2877 domain-containing protein [Ardenticatenales bacterium]|nr:DUF2877 domain-containing protein [Ardenticatenales bacterium]